MKNKLHTCIISQGDEILQGNIVNSNTQWLSSFFVGSQYHIMEHVTVGDDIKQLIATFSRCIHEYDVILSTGGLGPTEDDLTTKVISHISNIKLKENALAVQALQKYCTARSRLLTQHMKKMAFLPQNATYLENTIGSASGYHLHHQGTSIYVFPGVPTELKKMIQTCFFNLLEYDQKPLIFATFGLPESQIQLKLTSISKDIPISYHATPKANWITLYPKEEERKEIQEHIYDLLKEYIYDVGSSHSKKCSLVEVLAPLLLKRGEMVATAESCTAGKLSAWLTSLSGSSRYYKEGVIVYSNEAKNKYCDVSLELIKKKGAVCEEVSHGLAQGISINAQSTWGIGITGIAGPTGGSKEKPVGTVHISVYGHGKNKHKHCCFHGTRDQITDKACAQALFMLYQAIHNDDHSKNQ
jgi:nicotinamide-nucleotide amidase